MKEYLIYVNYSLSGFTIYKVTTEDIFSRYWRDDVLCTGSS